MPAFIKCNQEIFANSFDVTMGLQVFCHAAPTMKDHPSFTHLIACFSVYVGMKCFL